ncbi:MAG: DNA topoisomerase 4 subunit A [Lachnospiraceae bacterium]|nr:DNA topoisomerase 4 subunit A [Candidatus Equihabitans merdae]
MASSKTREYKEEHIIRTDYSEIMQKNYIDYAMSVIVSRALPDVRDGLKPVQRRVLYDMQQLGIRYNQPYRKSARIVGDTMGKYHPHGDSSIYDALVVLAQDFKKGQVLIDGHGNFGSIEGDGAAAMRYTEARLTKLAQEVYLTDLDKDVIDFMPNFDETEKEPTVLPVKIPNILINGAEGIAVGMATSIPTHNLSEVIEAVKAYIANNDITTEELLTYMPGPDFPTGGIVANKDDLLNIYETGMGKIRLRGKVEIEQMKGGKSALVMTEIPYTMIGAGIGKFLNDVAALAENHVTGDISDISNQSSKEGIRIVIELKKGADPEKLLNLLYKKTKLEDTFGVNMLAVCEGRPETMGLKRIIEAQVDFQIDVANRKYSHMLAKEQERREIQEGLIKACDVIDLIIEILRGSKTQAQAMSCLVNGEVKGIKFKTEKSRRLASKLNFTERQAKAILEMRLSRLIGLEIDALIAENKETIANIARYEDILNNYETMAAVIVSELDAIKKEFGRPRRTLLENAQEVVIEAPKIKEEMTAVLMDRFGYIKTIDESTFDKNHDACVNDFKYAFKIMNTDKLGVFTNLGKLHAVNVLDIKSGKLRDKGVPFDNLCKYDSSQEVILMMAPMSDILRSELFFATAQGLVKRIAGAELASSTRTIAATKLNDGDEVVFVGLDGDTEFAVLQTDHGYFLRFMKSEIPLLKKSAKGVKGMALVKGDAVSSAYLLQMGKEFQIEYKGKQVMLNRLKLAKHGGKGNKKS